MSFLSAQDIVNTAASGECVDIPQGDYTTLSIDKPLRLRCNGACFWADTSVPAIRISATNVTLENAYLHSSSSYDCQDVVLEMTTDSQCTFLNVNIYGRVTGLSEESDPWLLPAVLNLGYIESEESYFTFNFAAPLPCVVSTKIAGMEIDPSHFPPGINRVRIRVSDVTQDSLLAGKLEISTSQLTRIIPVYAEVRHYGKHLSPKETSVFSLEKKEIEKFTSWMSKKDCDRTNAEVRVSAPLQTTQVPAIESEAFTEPVSYAILSEEKREVAKPEAIPAVEEAFDPLDSATREDITESPVSPQAPASGNSNPLPGANQTLPSKPTGFTVPTPSPVLSPKLGVNVHAWRRFGARMFDFYLLSLIIGYGLQFVPHINNNFTDKAFGPLVLVAMVLLESILLCTVGTTPGKLLLEIKIRAAQGGRLGFVAALERSSEVFIKGMGFGVPLVALVLQVLIYKNLRNGVGTPWDQSQRYIQECGKVGILQAFLTWLFLIFSLFFALY